MSQSIFTLHLAARTLHEGGIVAYPTEAVYGLGCDPRNREAVCRLLALKRRPMHKGLILIAAEYAQLLPYIRQPSPSRRLWLEQSWPGPVTWLIPARSGVPRWLRGRHATIAVRVTAHPLAAALCRAFGGAIVSTSANPAGLPPARTPLAVRRYFGDRLDSVIHGKTGSSRNPTEIRDLADGRVLRPS